MAAGFTSLAEAMAPAAAAVAGVAGRPVLAEAVAAAAALTAAVARAGTPGVSRWKVAVAASGGLLIAPPRLAFSFVSGASHSKPSIVISRHGPRNAPWVSSSATGTAASEKTTVRQTGIVGNGRFRTGRGSHILNLWIRSSDCTPRGGE